MKLLKDVAEFKSIIGKELPPSSWMTVTQDMIQKFAEATGDFQWIHTDIERAKKESPFGAPIAHGFLTLSLVSKLLEDIIQIESLKMGVNYGLNKARFTSHVPVNSKVRLHAKLLKVEDVENNGIKSFLECLVEIEGSEKPACVAEFIALMFE